MGHHKHKKKKEEENEQEEQEQEEQGQYLTSGIFVVPSGVTSAFIEVFILNTDPDDNYQAEVRIFSVNNAIRTALVVSPLGPTNILSGRQQTFTTSISSGGTYEIEVYLEERSDMYVSSIVNDSTLGYLAFTQLVDQDYKEIKNFLG